jgi:hypothetical protein
LSAPVSLAAAQDLRAPNSDAFGATALASDAKTVTRSAEAQRLMPRMPNLSAEIFVTGDVISEFDLLQPSASDVICGVVASIA